MPKAEPAVEEPVTTGTGVMSIQDRIKSRLAKVNESTAAPATSKISVKGSVFTLPDGKSSKGPLNCVVLDYVNSNVFYEGAYEEGKFTAPACSAMGKEIKLMAPADDVENKQSDTCAACPQNEFGSKGRGKACQNGVVIAILPEDFTDESEVYTIRVSATALQGWGKYVRELSELNVDPIQVVTSLTFKEGLSYPSLKFRQVGGNERLDQVEKFLVSADTLLKAAG
mgnify:CR=1 FL=1|jgi:hypothetical protein|tara:strand:+ start:1384 stop:2061 length:678 start_codon:yes stop_codon:yes gene_type:complete